MHQEGGKIDIRAGLAGQFNEPWYFPTKCHKESSAI